MAYPQHGLSQPASALRYRFNWNAPIVVSTHDPGCSTTPATSSCARPIVGSSWTAISPDLTRNEKDKQGAGGAPLTNEGAGAEVYNTIFYLAESPLDKGVLWAGTDDGLLHVTRDGGQTWANVTPPASERSQVNAIEASPHDAATAYAGRHGLPPERLHAPRLPHHRLRQDLDAPRGRLARAASFVRVVREDPVRRGPALRREARRGAYVSFDGSVWQSLQLNLPVVPVTDLRVQGGDLVASTQGRSFWILDDLSALRADERRTRRRRPTCSSRRRPIGSRARVTTTGRAGKVRRGTWARTLPRAPSSATCSPRRRRSPSPSRCSTGRTRWCGPTPRRRSRLRRRRAHGPRRRSPPRRA